MRPRSGLALKHGITCLNTPGTIDEDYRGEVKVILANLGTEPFEVRRGERIAQLVPAPVLKAAFREVEETERNQPRRGRVRLDRPGGMNLSDAELERYARHIVLPQVGGIGQRRLKEASIAVVGAGGIGSAVIPALAGAGIGRLTIIDDDVVELGNLHRQPLFRERDAGYSKADLALQYVQRLNRLVEARPRAGADRPRQRATGAGRPRPGHRRQRQFRDAAGGQRCLRRTGHSAAVGGCRAVPGSGRAVPSQPCYRCFVGDAFDADDCDNCAELGVLGALTATVGQLRGAAGDQPHRGGRGRRRQGKLHLFDGEKLRWRAIRIPPDPRCRACGSA